MKSPSTLDPTTASDVAGERSTAKPSMTRLLPLVIIVIVVGAFFALGGNQYLSFESLGQNRRELLQWTTENPVLAAVIFFTAYTLVVAFSLPGATWMTLGGGFVFGTLMATVFVVSAATIGAVAIFLIARYCLADRFHAKMSPAALKMEAGFQANALSYLLFLRLVPAFPFWLINLVPAFVGVPLRIYIIGTFVGIIPGSVVYCSVGNGLGAVFDSGGTPDLGIIFQPEILAPIIAMAVLALVPIGYKWIKSRRGAADDSAQS